MRKRKHTKVILSVLFLPITGLYYLPKYIIMTMWQMAESLVCRLMFIVKHETAAMKKQISVEKSKRTIPFIELCSLWGINSDRQIAEMMRVQTIHIGIWLLCMVVGGYVAVASQVRMQVVCGTIFVIISIFGIFGAMWRKQVLQTREFEYFTDWLKFWN